MHEGSRRSVLQLLGGLTAGSLAGCSAADAPADVTTSDTATTAEGATSTADVTSTGTTTADETETTTTPPVATEAWTVTSFAGEVRELRLATGRRRADSTGGLLYAGTTAGTVAKLGVESGDVRWRFAAAGESSDRVPTVREVGSTLLVVSQTWSEETLRNYVERVDPATGERLWTFAEREFLSPVGVVDDVLYLAGEYIRMPPSELGPNQDPAGEGRLHAVDLATGEERWRVTVPSLADATVADHGLYANVGVADSASEKVVAYGRDGTERWRVPGGTYFNPGPVAMDDGVLASAYGDSAAAFAPDGTERWRVSRWENGPTQFVATPRRLYVGSEPLVGLSRSGSERWRLDDYGDVVTPVLDGRAGQTLYAVANDAVDAIDPATGTKRWTFTPDAKYVYARGVVDAGLVIDTRNSRPRTFTLLDEATGAVRGEFSIGDSYATATAIGSRLFVGATGAVYAVDVEG